jgi:hypothetical protein
MTTITHQLAATHENWRKEPVWIHAEAAIRPGHRHLERQYSLIALRLEWFLAAAAAGLLTIGCLVANA